VSVRDGDLVALGGDLQPATLLNAYRAGLFPMRLLGRRGPLGWWSPDPRGVLPVRGFHLSRSLRRTRRRFEIRVDTAFDDVVGACASIRRPGGWIGRDIRNAYARLHAVGAAHSIEAWRADTLVGGLYGVSIGGLFAGESMFHTETDASKAALSALVDLLDDAHAADRLIDVQWQTPHLASLGVVAIPRAEYLERLDVALTLPTPAAFSARS
jgi:leucyl/phenylalanyl-tRNA--protein transferase